VSVAGYLVFIFRFGVNAIYWDEWNFVPLVARSMSRHLTFSQLWAQHNEDRIFVPNVIAIILARTTRWNDFAFYLFSAVLLMATFAVMARIFRDEIKRAPLWFIVLPLVAFTLAQFENTLWAFQIAWFLVLFCIVASMSLLSSRDELMGMALAGAILLGVIASYSSLQGLLVWPIGLVALFTRGHPYRLRCIWGLSGVAAILVYFIGFSYSNAGFQPMSTYFHDVGTTAQAFFIAVGNVITNQRVNVDPLGVHATVLIGIVLTVGACAVVASWFIEGRPSGAKCFIVSLVLIGLGFDLFLIPTRLFDNMIGGTPSRYATFNWPLLIGVYLAAVIWRTEGTRWNARSIALRTVVLALVVSQVIVGTASGVADGRSDRSVRLTSADVLANASAAPGFLVRPYLYPPSATYVHDLVPFLMANKMNVFAGENSKNLQALGIVPGGQQPPVLLEPDPVREWVRDDENARKAWNVLSAVYSSSGGALAVYPSSATGSALLVLWAATRQPIPANELSVWVVPPAQVFLQQYEQYYEAWEVVLTWRSYRMPPVPTQFKKYLSTHPAEALAWNVLSGAYTNSRTLRRQFSSVDSARFLSWAAMVGSVPPGGLPALIPLHGEFVTLARRD